MRFRVDQTALIPSEVVKFEGLADDLDLITPNGRWSPGPCPICGTPHTACFEPTPERYEEHGTGTEESTGGEEDGFEPELTSPIG